MEKRAKRIRKWVLEECRISEEEYLEDRYYHEIQEEKKQIKERNDE